MSDFLDQPVKIGESFTRPDSAIEHPWTYAVVPGPRYDRTKPAYVLTGRRIFSVAEAIAGALRRYRHAIVVGDTTRGGGRTGDFLPVGERFMLFVPSGASTSADDVEGHGLRPASSWRRIRRPRRGIGTPSARSCRRSPTRRGTGSSRRFCTRWKDVAGVTTCD